VIGAAQTLHAKHVGWYCEPPASKSWPDLGTRPPHAAHTPGKYASSLTGFWRLRGRAAYVDADAGVGASLDVYTGVDGDEYIGLFASVDADLDVGDAGVCTGMEPSVGEDVGPPIVDAAVDAGVDAGGRGKKEERVAWEEIGAGAGVDTTVGRMGGMGGRGLRSLVRFGLFSFIFGAVFSVNLGVSVVFPFTFGESVRGVGVGSGFVGT
jgi:hypothetical protein